MYRRRRERRHYRRRRENYNVPVRGITSVLRRPSTQIATLIIVALVIYLILQAGNSLRRSPSSLPNEISVSEAFTKYQSGAFVIDVRTVEEWNEVHIPNTILIPLDQVAARLNEIPKDREVVVVCRSGDCSRQGSDLLFNAGFIHVASMAGGLNDWRLSGYPTEP